MLLLSAVNEVLPKLGEHPVTSTEAQSPTLAVVIPQIKSTLRNLLTQGWWFNTSRVKFFPDSEKFVDTPVGLLKFIPEAGVTAVARGERFYDIVKQSYEFDAPFSGAITTLLDFEELPESVAQRVLYEALVIIYATDIGLEQVIQIWDGMAKAAQASMEAEHLQNMRYSTKTSRRYLNLRRAMRG